MDEDEIKNAIERLDLKGDGVLDLSEIEEAIQTLKREVSHTDDSHETINYDKNNTNNENNNNNNNIQTNDNSNQNNTTSKQ